uniref:F-box domain-containing protein n=1 Tax=Kalanchoe fedtschenkoi TaxID=63787 RepID=A0A7N0U5A6_KALFE
MAMVDWSQLPKDLLLQIAESLDAPFDILRFRSVCSAWRSTVLPKPRRLPKPFPLLPPGGVSDTTWGFLLSKRTIYRISNPAPHSDEGYDWIVKIEEDVPDRMHLLNPLSGVRFKPLPSSFARNLDMLKFRVSELGQEYVMRYVDYRRFANSLGEASSLYMEKVVFRHDGNPSLSAECTEAASTSFSAAAGFQLLTIHISGRLAMFKSGDKKWRVIKEMQSPYDDVKLFRGHFYAVDNNGRTVMVESASKIELVAGSVFGGDKKYLVESLGRLLLVDMYLTMDVEEGPEDDGEEQFLRSLNERIVRFKVYRLAENERKWEELESLGDQILFLGENCTFAVSAADLSGYEGNCIYILNCTNGGDDSTEGFHATDIGVYHLNSSKIKPLTSESEHWKLFWPPPAWVSTTMRLQSQLEDLSL